ncbi:GSCOCG00011008001-RA-CDS, partial [Cotesia congregata]
TCSTIRPYENGEMFNMFRRVASEAPTLSPGFKMWTSCLLGTQTGVLGRNDDTEGRDGTSTSWSADFVLQKLVTDFNKVAAGEDEADVSANVGKKFLQSCVALNVTADGFAHHGVLSHEHHCVSTQGHTDLLHLL